MNKKEYTAQGIYYTENVGFNLMQATVSLKYNTTSAGDITIRSKDGSDWEDDDLGW